jgi:hypothetical protein
MNTNDIMSQIEMNKAIIQRYFDAYNNKNETIFDEIISSDYIDHGQTASTVKLVLLFLLCSCSYFPLTFSSVMFSTFFGSETAIDSKAFRIPSSP